ncbi:MAG: hypothetical protein H6Q14_894 [Bacteroidetes bacterium]|nr:hypothetical protein [Bacteroidota bacterium]
MVIHLNDKEIVFLISGYLRKKILYICSIYMIQRWLLMHIMHQLESENRVSE